MFAKARGSNNETWFATVSSSVRPGPMELWEVRWGAELFYMRVHFLFQILLWKTCLFYCFFKKFFLQHMKTKFGHRERI